MTSIDDSTPRPSTWAVWLGAIRPATLVASVLPVMVASAMAYADGVFAAGAAACALLGALSIQMGTNLFNDAEDFKRGADTHARLGPARATQRGWLTARQTRSAAFIAFAMSGMFGAYLVALAGWPLVLIGMISVVCGLAYTGGPWPLAYTGLGDLFVLLFFGVVAVCGAYYVQALTLTPEVFLMGTAVGALATALLVVNNLRDRHTDALANKRTLAVRFGATFTRMEYVVLVMYAFVVPVAAWTMGLAPSAWLLACGALPIAAGQIWGVLRRDGAELNQHLGGSARAAFMYCALFSMGLITA